MSLVPLVSSHPRLLSSCLTSQALQTLNDIEVAGTSLGQLCDCWQTPDHDLLLSYGKNQRQEWSQEDDEDSYFNLCSSVAVSVHSGPSDKITTYQVA